MSQGGYIYWFRCAVCHHVWQRWVASPGAGGMGGRCPNCGCANVAKIDEQKVK